MYVLTIKYCIIPLYILAISITVSNSYTTKHSKYKSYTMEDNRLCSVVANRKVELKKDREEAVIVTQTTTKDHSLDWNANWHCKFQVLSDSGLYAVIQSMNFRKNQSTGECIDYVKFETRSNTYNKKLCETFNIATEYIQLATTIDMYGYIETTIFISKESWKEKDKMDLKIVYTKFKRCNSLYSPCTSNQCIHNEFFNDSLVNCPSEGCSDETDCQSLQERLCAVQNCHTRDSEPSSSISTKIVLSAVTSLVVSFAVFIICIWVCKKTGKVCWTGNCSSNSQPRRSSRVIEMQNRTEPTVQVPPTAPDPEKDLPPSYDSLFPS